MFGFIIISIPEIVIVNFILLIIGYLLHRSIRKHGKLPKTWLAVLLSLIPMGPPLAGLTYVMGILYTAILYLPVWVLVYYTSTTGAEGPVYFAFAAIAGYLSYRKNKQSSAQG